MAGGLIALLDDVAAIAKVAAASLDDVAAAAGKAGAKAAGIVVDDAAVTPRYVTGFSAQRELPIIARIAMGSLRNKLVFLLPGALILSLVAPWAITPLLMAGGLFLCFEGYEKVHSLFAPAHGVTAEAAATTDAQALEEQKVASAIRTDLILSAEIMAIALATVADQAFWTRAAVLAVVGTGITLLVYGVVAVIVKLDDIGLAMSRGRLMVTRTFGRGLVKAMPHLLGLLGMVGTAAMLWVGGGILVHGLAGFGYAGPEHALHEAGAAVARLMPVAPGFVRWLVEAAGAGILGLVAGWIAAQGIGLVGLLRRADHHTAP